MKVIGYIVVIGISLIFSYILNGYALSILWKWFIVDAFGLLPISISTAIGLSLTVGYLTHQMPADDETKSAKDTFIRAISVAFTKPLMALLAGRIITLFI